MDLHLPIIERIQKIIGRQYIISVYSGRHDSDGKQLPDIISISQSLPMNYATVDFEFDAFKGITDVELKSRCLVVVRTIKEHLAGDLKCIPMLSVIQWYWHRLVGTNWKFINKSNQLVNG